MDNEKEIDIDLGKIFFMMRKRIIYIILATIACTVISGCITEFFITPKYTTSSTLFTYSNTDRISSDITISANELMASQELAKTYIFVLTSDGLLEKVIEKLELKTTPAGLRSMISCSQVDELQIIRVTVTSSNPELSANIANAIADVAPVELVKKVKAGGVTVIDYAKVPSNPSSPNLKKNIVIGAAIGFLASFIGFFGYELFDTTITSEKDIEREFDVPLLGSIPKLIPTAEKEHPAADTDKTQKPKKFGRKGAK